MTKFLNISTDNTLGGSSASDVLVSSQKAIKDYVDGLKTDWYGTCATAAGTQTKVVVCDGFVLRTGVSIRVLFSKAQTYNGVPKLNVNSTGAIDIYYLGETAGTRYLWQTNELVSFTYDGSHWVMEDGGLATTTYYGYTKLSTNGASTSTSLAATPSAINLAMNGIVTGYPSFSSSATYAVGDRVRYSDGYMYECTTAVTTAGDWNASDWTVLPDLQTQINDKVDKVTGNYKIYGTDGSGGQTSYNMASIATANTIAYRTTGGVLNVGTPTADGHAATKKYVDDSIPTVNDATITITQGGVTKGSFTLNQSSAQTIALDAGGGGGGSSNIPYGTSDSATDATEKTVSIPEITALNVGQIIIVQPSITSSVANSTLKLNNFPAYPMLYAGSAITTSTDSYVWRANTPATWRFDGTNWVFLSHGYDFNTTYTSMNAISDAGQYTAGSGTYAITRYSLIMQKADMTWEKVTATNKTYSTATTKSVNTNGFRLNQIRYYSTTTILANGELSATNVVFSQAASVDMRYSTNCGGTTDWVAGDYIYLVGTMGVDGLFYLDTTTWWSKTLPNTNDGKLYIRLGLALADEGYTMSFFSDRPIFYHDGAGIKEYKVADNKANINMDNITDAGKENIAKAAYHPGLFAHEWDDHIRNDVSWLRADTFSWQSGAVYQAAYAHLADDIDGKTLQSETIGSITIQFYLADDGHKVCPASEESNVVAIYNTTGVAWYYVVDTTNERFKLPRTQYGFVGSRGNVGNYVPETLPNITDYMNNVLFGSAGVSVGGARRVTNSGGYAIKNDGTNEFQVQTTFDASTQCSTYQNDAPVQQRATQMYLYFYVGQFTQTALENTAGVTTEVLNDKVDKGHQVVEFQEPTSANGYTWYRKYADGWVEQGGFSSGEPRTATLAVAMADTNYSVICVQRGTTAPTAAEGSPRAGAISTTQIYVNGGVASNDVCWQVSGMAA